MTSAYLLSTLSSSSSIGGLVMPIGDAVVPATGCPSACVLVIADQATSPECGQEASMSVASASAASATDVLTMVVSNSSSAAISMCAVSSRRRITSGCSV